MFNVNREKCIACRQCIKDCPVKVISLLEGKAEINNEGCIKCGHCIAICPTFAISTDDYDMNEVIPYNKADFDIEAERLLNFIKFRRSIRRFKNTKVEKDKLSYIIEAGRFTQTGRNLQDVSYTVVTDEIHQLKKLVFESLKKIADYITYKSTEANEIKKKYAAIWQNMYDQYITNPDNDRLFYNAPAAIIVTSPNTLDGALASSNMQLMCSALGLGTFFCGFMTLASQDNKEILDFLNVKENYNIVSCMIIGYPEPKYQRTVPRKKPDITWL